MDLKSELETAVRQIFRDQWSNRDGQVVPDPEDLLLGNDAVDLDATVLYADMADSTDLVDQHKPSFAAEIYKSYMVCAARILKSEGGTITAYDGDRVMGVFIGPVKNTSATRAALKIAWAVNHIVNPSIRAQYGDDAYQMQQCIGIDTSSLMACRIGIRNNNDVVWVGSAANYAAKLSNLRGGFTFIRERAFNKLRRDVRYGGTPEELMWERCCWTDRNNETIYRSFWEWSV